MRRPRGYCARENRSFFCLKTLAPRRLPAAGPVRCPLPHSGSPAPAANHTYIDAFNGKTVTRETLLRYTLKSRLVNVLIRGFLWITSVHDDDSSSIIVPLSSFLSPGSFFS